MDIIALVLLILFFVLGLIAVVFTSVGTLVILLGGALYALMTAFEILTWKDLLALGALYGFGELMEYVLTVFGAKKMGASTRAVIGAVLGGIVGAALGVALFGLGLLMSTLLGVFLGGFIVELCMTKDWRRAFWAGTGSLLGRLGSILFKMVIALGMIVWIGLRIAAWYQM